MGRLALIFILLFSVSLWAQDVLQGIREFFQREGYVVKVDANRVLIDLGREKVRVGEEFTILKEGKEIVHPITKQVIGRESQQVGVLRVEEV
ncbi:MAG: hypothetical protein WKI46_01505, partial [Aquificaceae bacterium]